MILIFYTRGERADYTHIQPEHFSFTIELNNNGLIISNGKLDQSFINFVLYCQANGGQLCVETI